LGGVIVDQKYLTQMGCSKSCLGDITVENFGLGLKPILLRIAPESTSLQEQFVSAQANLFLYGWRD